MQENVLKNVLKLLNEKEVFDPHSLLGLQNLENEKRVIRLWRPEKATSLLEVKGAQVEPYLVDEKGLYEYEVASHFTPFDYRVALGDNQWGFDPYAMSELVGELDAYLISKGLHYQLYNLLGATPRVYQTIRGIHFAVWAPNAVSVFLIGDFNHWNRSLHPMRMIRSTGVWELFIPNLIGETCYKFNIISKDKKEMIKSDPVGHYFQVRPENGSLAFDVNRYRWSDGKWLEKRKKGVGGNLPINIYEVHLGSWQKKGSEFLNYRELASRLISYCHKMHYTHVELMGICEHPLDESWGYQVTGYFAPTSRFGNPEDFQFFVDELHQNDIGVILDWVPAHFPTDPHSLCRFDGTYLYEHIDPRQGYHPHWNTHIFNYGRFEVSNFLIASALFWIGKMHVDGLRVDAVASMLYLDYGRDVGQWIPNEAGENINLLAVEFLKHMNSIVHELHPDVLMIAEESTAFPKVTGNLSHGSLGFDLKWNLGWMNDTLQFFCLDFDQRGKALENLTFAFEYAFNEQFVLVLSHDEVVHEKGSLFGKMPGDPREKRAGLKNLIGFMMTFPGKKLLFMGGELGQPTEWNSKESIPWNLLEEKPHLRIQEMVSALNHFYLANPALHDDDQSSFEWVIPSDSENVLLAFLRKGGGQTLLCIHHFAREVLDSYPIRLRRVKEVALVFDTASSKWGGSGNLDRDIAIGAGEIILPVSPLSTQIFNVQFFPDSETYGE